MGIEMEAECLRQIVQVIHTGNHTYRRTLLQCLVQCCHGFGFAAEFFGMDFYAEPLGYPFENIPRPYPERGAWYAAYFYKGKMPEENTGADTESHRFGYIDTAMF